MQASKLVPAIVESLQTHIPYPDRLWLVGGAVRDRFLDRATRDFDFAVDGDARAVARAVADGIGGAYYELDRERDAGRVVLQRAGHLYTFDFTRLRGGNINQDLLKRDFSVNAMAVNLARPEELIDPARGVADLKTGTLRACYAGAISDDPIRAVRGVRLAAQFGLTFEAGTQGQMKLAADQIGQVSAERVRDEVFELFALPDPAGPLRALDQLNLMAPIFPELEPLRGLTQSKSHDFDALTHTLAVVKHLARLVRTLTEAHDPEAAAELVLAQASLKLGRFREELRTHLEQALSVGRPRRSLLILAALYHDAGKAETASQDERGVVTFPGHEAVSADAIRRRAEALRLSRREVVRLDSVVRQHTRPGQLQRQEPISDRQVYRYYRDCGEAGIEVALLSLADLLGMFSGPPPQLKWQGRVRVARRLLQAYFESADRLINPPSLVSGADLIHALGLQPGPIVGQLLEHVREAQVAGEVHDREQALDAARQALEQGG